MVPDEDIEIVFSGVRPGEKLFEELSTSSERADKTKHPKIFIGRTPPSAGEDTARLIRDLLELAEGGAGDAVGVAGAAGAGAAGGVGGEGASTSLGGADGEQGPRLVEPQRVRQALIRLVPEYTPELETPPAPAPEPSKGRRTGQNRSLRALRAP
jgi:hypothetical protein